MQVLLQNSRYFNVHYMYFDIYLQNMLFAKVQGKKISYSYICPKVLKISYITYRLFFFPQQLSYVLFSMYTLVIFFLNVILVLCYLALTEIEHIECHLFIHSFVRSFVYSSIHSFIHSFCFC